MENQQFLFIGQGGRFSCRSQGNQEVYSGEYLALRGGTEGLNIYNSVSERSKHGCTTARKYTFHYSNRYLLRERSVAALSSSLTRREML